MSPDFWRGRRVLVTGHTGFKGAWLVTWLQRLGAEVTGFALPAEEPSLYTAARVSELCRSRVGDVRDLPSVVTAFEEARPEVVFHMAAQALVRRSYEEPVDTYSTNVMGTVHVLEACRRARDVRAIVVVTTDKCYENNGWVWGYRESEPMGGHDPYSSSKACTELVASAYRRSFLAEARIGLATARAGNVIGGGDWAADRLIPDAMRAFAAGRPVTLRNPAHVRPWQHVLEPLAGYLTLAERLSIAPSEHGEGWNFGPVSEDSWSVERVVRRLAELWEGGATYVAADGGGPHEAHELRLDISKARVRLGWTPRTRLSDSLGWVARWYAAYGAGADARGLMLRDLTAFEELGP